MALVIGTTYSKNGSSTGVSYLSAGIDYVLVSQNKTTNKSKIRIFPWMKTTTTNTAYNYNDRTATAKVGSLSKSGKTDYDMREATVNAKTYITSSVPFRRISGDFKLVEGRYCFEFDVAHNENGILNDLEIEVVIPSSNGASATDSTATVTVDLPQIQRQNTLSWNGKYIDDPIYFTITKYNDSYTTTIHSLWELESEGGSTPVRSIEIANKTTAKSFEFELSETELQEILYGNANSKIVGVYFYVSTYNGDTEIGEAKMYGADFSIKQQNPEVSATIVDTDENTISLTGDNSIIVKYLSKPKVTIEATAKQYANIKSYSTEWGTKKSTTQKTTFSQGIDSDKLTIKATDTRDWSSTQTYDFTSLNRFIDYIKLVHTKFDITKEETSSETLNLDIDGNWFNGNFSETNPNELSIKYRYKEKDGEFNDYQPLEFTIDNNTFSCKAEIGTFNISKQYSLEIVTSDKATRLTTTFDVLSNNSILRVGETYVRINGDLRLNGNLVLNGIPYNPFDYILITDNNTNPSSYLGGTWTLIDKEFKELKAEDNSGNYFTINETGATSYTLFLIRNKKSIYCRLNVYNAVELSDNDVIFGNLNFQALGISRLYFGHVSSLGATDGGNTAFQFSINWETGKVTSNDILPKSDTESVGIGKSCYMYFELPCHTEYMLDSACDKFYWKRTS